MKKYGWFGLGLLVLSEFCLFNKIEPFYSWFYCFAWWSYILMADNLLLKLRGRSLLSGRRHEFWSMCALSVFIWLLFESYNLVIRNWAYDGVPHELWLRWPGYAAAFSTVLPGIFITSDLVDMLFAGRPESFASECDPLTEQPASRPFSGFILIGLFLSAAPLVWPRYFFPAIWLGPIFLLDPLLERFGLHSLSLDISLGKRRRTWSLLMGGLACGLMWEFWNFWAASKWVYRVPFFTEWKVFEMPLAGFLGFPPFALECWILYHLLREILRRSSRAPVRVAYWMIVAALSVVIFRAMDTRTVLRFAEHLHRSIGSWSTG